MDDQPPHVTIIKFNGGEALDCASAPTSTFVREYYGVRWNCDGEHYEVPMSFRPQAYCNRMTVLRIHSLKSLSFPDGFLEELPGLLSLSLINCSLTHCPRLAPRLERLTLSRNMLKCIPPTVFECRHLMTLGLRHNFISEVTSDISRLRSLTELDLSGNEITYVDRAITRNILLRFHLRWNRCSVVLPLCSTFPQLVCGSDWRIGRVTRCVPPIPYYVNNAMRLWAWVRAFDIHLPWSVRYHKQSRPKQKEVVWTLLLLANSEASISLLPCELVLILLELSCDGDLLRATESDLTRKAKKKVVSALGQQYYDRKRKILPL